MDIHDLIEKFNDGDTDFIKYINDIQTFLRIVNKRGLIGELDPEGKFADEYQNDLLLFYYENDNEKFWEYVLKFLGDVDIINGVPYLVLGSQGSLAELFCDDRDMARSTVEEILDGDYDMNHWSSYDLTDNVYRDVVEELTKENLLHLKDYIIKTLEGQQVDVRSELLNSIAEQQGNEYVIVDQSNIDQIVDDEETMKELMDNELSDLKSELYSVYANSYTSAYENELYEDLWNELSSHFDVKKRQWVSRPHTYKKDTEIQKFIVPIVDFEGFIIEYLNSNNGYSNGTLEYWGSYISILKEEIRCLSMRVPDYPDSREVDKNINMYFGDYI